VVSAQSHHATEPEAVFVVEAGGLETAQAAAGGAVPAQVAAIVDEVLAENPELAQIPEDKRMQLISETLDELQAS
jgi:hypothetical protein